MNLTGNFPRGEYQELIWEEARSFLVGLNDELVSIIDEINPSKRYTFFKIKYSYGSKIVKRGNFYLPNKLGQLCLLSDDSIPKTVKNKLQYNFGSNPVGVLLNKKAELYINLGDRIIPFAIISPGEVFGIWKILDDEISHCPPRFFWDLTAGARTIFMLPPISKAAYHERLRQDYLIASDKPSKYLDHHTIFTEIANFDQKSGPWELEMLFFSDIWFKKLKGDDAAWRRFNRYLLEVGWDVTEYWRNKFLWDMTYSWIQNRRKLKPTAYTAHIVKQLFTIALGVLPGFAPSTDDTMAPISVIQKAYLESYQLEHYSPIVMQPKYFDFHAKPDTIYYSLQLPTVMELVPKSNERGRVIDCLHEINSLIQNYLIAINSSDLGIKATPMYEIPQLVQFNLLHSNITEGQYRAVQKSEVVLKEDRQFTRALNQYPSNVDLPAHIPFFQGCIQIVAS